MKKEYGTDGNYGIDGSSAKPNQQHSVCSVLASSVETKMRNALYNLVTLVTLLLALAAVMPAQTLPAQTFPRELHEVYNLNPDGTITVTNTSGYIRITTWNENRVQVDAVKNARREEDWPLIEIRVVSQPSRLEITTVYPRGRSNSTSVNYDLKVPRSAVLNNIASTSGDVTITGPIASVIARSTSGSVMATDVAGNANLASTSGNATAKKIGGSLSISATSGNVTATDVAARATARCASGAINLSNVRDDASAYCASGSIRLEKIGGRAAAQSSSGSVTILNVGGDVEAASNSDNVLIEDVRGRVVATSFTGNVIVRKVDEGVRATATSSNIEITSAKGRIEAETISGSITLREVDSRDLRLKSLSSSVRYQGKLYADGRYEFNSFSGDVVVTLPPDSEFNLTAQSFSGTINTEFPIQLTAGKLSSRGPVQGVAGKGGAQLKAESFSGSVHIKKQVAQAR